MKNRTLILNCGECSGISEIIYDDDEFIEPEKCPFCGLSVFDIEEQNLSIKSQFEQFITKMNSMGFSRKDVINEAQLYFQEKIKEMNK